MSSLTRLYDDLVREELKSQSHSTQQEEVEGISLIGRTKKAIKKRYKEKEGSGTGKKDLSKVMCFR
jgi:hypothetical protein